MNLLAGAYREWLCRCGHGLHVPLTGKAVECPMCGWRVRLVLAAYEEPPREASG